MQYYYTQNGQQYGPFTLEELQQKSINKDTLIWRPGMEKWVGAGELAELSVIFPPIVPGPPPLPNNAYIPYHAPATPKGDRSWIGIVAAVGLVVALVVFLVWRESNKSSAPVMGPTTDMVQLNQDSLDQVEREKAEKAKRDQAEKKIREGKLIEAGMWPALVRAKVTNIDFKTFGGMHSVRLQVENNLDYEVTWMVVWVDYILKNGAVFHTEEVQVKNMSPKEVREVIAPGMSRGWDVKCKVQFLVVPDLNLEIVPADT